MKKGLKVALWILMGDISSFVVCSWLLFGPLVKGAMSVEHGASVDWFQPLNKARMG